MIDSGIALLIVAYGITLVAVLGWAAILMMFLWQTGRESEDA